MTLHNFSTLPSKTLPACLSLLSLFLCHHHHHHHPLIIIIIITIRPVVCHGLSHPDDASVPAAVCRPAGGGLLAQAAQRLPHSRTDGLPGKIYCTAAGQEAHIHVSHAPEAGVCSEDVSAVMVIVAAAAAERTFVSCHFHAHLSAGTLTLSVSDVFLLLLLLLF